MDLVPNGPPKLAKILIVDDLADKLLVYEAILRDMNLELVMATSGEKALREVLHHDFAVILLDVNMPGMDGFEAANLIRGRKKSAHTPIIFVTAYNDELRMAEGYSRGAVDFITTPIIPQVLRAKVRVFVDLFRMTEQVREHAQQQIALTEERAHRTAAEEANRRLSFLVRGGGIINRSLDRKVIIENVLRLLTPEQADSAALGHCHSGEWTFAHSTISQGAVDIAEEVRREEMPAHWQQAIDHILPNKVNGDCHYDPVTPIFEARLVAVPLRDRDSVFGVLLASLAPDRAAWTAADFQLFESISSRSAIALTNAKLFEEIEFANQQKNRFLSMLAHELRNPLAPIQSAVDLIRLCRLQDDNLNAAREVIDRQVAHMVRLVDDLLDVSRISLGKIRLSRQRIDARDVIASALEISGPQIESQRHKLQVEMPDAPVWIEGDAARLSQVMSNLLNNSAKYTPPEGQIYLTLQCDNDEAVFRVVDTGVGIPPSMLDRVFDLFTQVEHSASRSGGGLGVGLTLVKEIVERHNGRVEVASEGIDKGSEFSIVIPLSGEQANRAAEVDVKIGAR